MWNVARWAALVWLGGCNIGAPTTEDIDTEQRPATPTANDGSDGASPAEPVRRPAVPPVSHGAELGDLHRRLGEARFSTQKLDIVQEMLPEHELTCKELLHIMGHFPLDADRLKVLRVGIPQLQDPENAELLVESFGLGSRRRAAAALFEPQ